MADSRRSKGSGITLYGFDDFLHGKTIHFVGPRPVGKMCLSCGVVYCCITPSKCFHVFCLTCSLKILKLGKLFNIRRDSFKKPAAGHLGETDVYDYKVRCLNAPHGCLFEGRLADLERHVLERCLHNPETCRECGEQVPPSQLADHSLLACGRRPTAAVGFSEPSSRRRSCEKDVVHATDSSGDVPEPVQAALKWNLRRKQHQGIAMMPGVEVSGKKHLP
ncbi:hypothetical protein V5799_031889 [Amblyomma americanum]|uniref:Uncharacterized protein n=1 Tax=Amblyomma americanum TaxID=6943 RepID=A0AAQ4DSR2_AMBAM